MSIKQQQQQNDARHSELHSINSILLFSKPRIPAILIFFRSVSSSLFCNCHELSITIGFGNYFVLWTLNGEHPTKSDWLSSLLNPLANEWCRKCSHFFTDLTEESFWVIFHEKKNDWIECSSSSNRDEKFDTSIRLVWSEWMLRTHVNWGAYSICQPHSMRSFPCPITYRAKGANISSCSTNIHFRRRQRPWKNIFPGAILHCSAYSGTMNVDIRICTFTESPKTGCRNVVQRVAYLRAAHEVSKIEA